MNDSVASDSPVSAVPSTARNRISGLWRDLPADVIVVLPAAAAALYLAGLAYRFRRILEALYWNSDLTFLPLLAEELRSLRPAGSVNMGDTPYFSTFWFLLATESLPFHRSIWAVAPYLLALTTIGLIAWSCRKAAGAWSGILAFSIGIAASPAVLTSYMGAGLRVATWFSIALLLWFSVILTVRSDDRLSLKVLVGAFCVAIVSATTVASDPLFLAGGLGPFLGAALILRMWDPSRGRLRQLMISGSIVAFAGVVGTGFSRWMKSLGFSATFPQRGFQFASGEEISQNAATLLGDVVYMGNGWFFGQPLEIRSGITVVAAALAIGAACLPFLLFMRVLKSPPPRRGPLAPRSAVFAVVVFFWALAATAITVVFVFSKIPVGTGLASFRYAVPLFLAAAGVVPLWASGSWRRLVAAMGAAVLALLGTAAQPGLFSNLSQQPLAGNAPGLIAFLKDQGLSRGYAAYWDAHALSWNSQGALRAYPVIECRRPQSTLPCPFPLAARDAWYRPEPGSRSFILTSPEMVGSLSLVPSPDLGPPALYRRFGELSLFVYDYDVAVKFFPVPVPPQS